MCHWRRLNGDNLSAILYKILNEEVAPPSTVNLGVPPVFDRIIARALAKRPEDRYQTAGEFARDLGGDDAPVPQKPRPPATDRWPGQTGRAPTEHEATLCLTPQQAGSVRGVSQADGGGGIQLTPASFLGSAQGRRMRLLLAIPVLLVVGWVMVWQGLPSKRAALPTADTPEIETVHIDTPPPLLPAVSGIEMPEVPAAIVQARATLTLAVSPWGEVFVDGKRVGVSPPLATLPLEPGRHVVEIRNQGFASYRATVNLEPGESYRIRHKFR